MSEFRGEMKTLVQTYVELLYPDDLEMQDALFENITTGKASVTVDEMRDYVATRSSWYAEIEAVNPAMAVVHNQNDEFVGTVEVMDMDDDPDGVEVFINDEQMNEISSINLYEDDRFWEDYDAETFFGHSTEPICTTYACRTEIGGTHKGSDAMRFLAFLNEIKNLVGIRNISYEHEGDEGAFGVVVFKFDICRSGYKPTIAQVMAQLNGLRNGMILRGADYEDLHRPIQTLAEGDEPNEEWYMEAETFNAMSFKQWSQDEMNEELHGGQDMDFDSWLKDEIHTHGNIPLREWGYEEEHDEPEHQHAEFGLFTPHPSPPEPKDKLTGEDGYYTLPQIKRMIARDMIYHSSDGDVDFNDIFDDAEIEILTSWADEAGEDVREYIEDRFLTYSELVTAVTNASSLKGMQRIFEAYKFPYRVTADRKLSDGSYEYKLELIPKFKKAQAESMMSEDYMTDEEILRAARNDIDNQISRGTFYTLGQEPQAFHDGEIDGENFYTIISLYCQYAEDEDRCEKKLQDMFKKDYAEYMGDESFYAESMMSKRGKVRTLSGKPHKARKLKKDGMISPEEAKTRLSFRAKKGIDTYAEPFDEIGNFYSGKKGILKIVGLGALVSAGVWITKNKLLE